MFHCSMRSCTPLLATGRISAKAPAGGYYQAPLLFGPVDPGAALAQEEVFGPVLVIIRAKANDLQRNCVPPDSPGHPRTDHTVLECLHVILKEEWQHHRYAVRDLQVLENRSH